MTRIVQRKSIAMIVYAVLLALTAFLFTRIPRGSSLRPTSST